MALAFATDFRDVWGTRFVRRVKITLDNAYPNGGTKATNGWAITAAQLGFGGTSTIVAVILQHSILDGYLLEWDPTNGRLHVFQGDNTNAAAAPGVELANNSAVMDTKNVFVLAIGTGQQT
jgi:hypothetical protein